MLDTVKRNEYHIIHIRHGGHFQPLNLNGINEDVHCSEEGVSEGRPKSFLAADRDTMVTILSAPENGIATHANVSVKD
jgi:hypothetical protein